MIAHAPSEAPAIPAIWTILAGLLPVAAMMAAPFMARAASRHAWRATMRSGEGSKVLPPAADGYPGDLPLWSLALPAMAGVCLMWGLAAPLIEGMTWYTEGRWQTLLDHVSAIGLPLVLLALLAAGAISDAAWWYLPDRIVLPLLVLAGLDGDWLSYVSGDFRLDAAAIAAGAIHAAAIPCCVAIAVHAGSRLAALAQVLVTGRMAMCPPDIAILAIPFLLFPIDGGFFDQLDLVFCFTLSGCLILCAALLEPPAELAGCVRDVTTNPSSCENGEAGEMRGAEGPNGKRSHGRKPPVRSRLVPFGVPMLTATGTILGLRLVMEMNGWR